jgi:hypothetical protein
MSPLYTRAALSSALVLSFISVESATLRSPAVSSKCVRLAVFCLTSRQIHNYFGGRFFQVTETLKICDRAYMVFQGQVMAQGAPQELVRNPYVREYYLGEGYKPPDWQNEGRGRADPMQASPSLEKGSLR